MVLYRTKFAKQNLVLGLNFAYINLVQGMQKDFENDCVP